MYKEEITSWVAAQEKLDKQSKLIGRLVSRMESMAELAEVAAKPEHRDLLIGINTLLNLSQAEAKDI